MKEKVGHIFNSLDGRWEVKRVRNLVVGDLIRLDLCIYPEAKVDSVEKTPKNYLIKALGGRIVIKNSGDMKVIVRVPKPYHD